MSEGHYIEKCSCGFVLGQCRCRREKKVIVKQDGCDACKAKLEEKRRSDRVANPED